MLRCRFMAHVVGDEDEEEEEEGDGLDAVPGPGDLFALDYRLSARK